MHLPKSDEEHASPYLGDSTLVFAKKIGMANEWTATAENLYDSNSAAGEAQSIFSQLQSFPQTASRVEWIFGH
jgi:hypothetical protein